jgi:NAD(P)-dependent dehydrogenase (short-subunit alcohol dehydrogenase family)
VSNYFQILILVFLAVFSFTSFAGDSESQKANQKTVLVTGASSGIGLKITQVLSENGYLVYAGARKDADLQRLNAMNNVESVRLDVTDQEQIDAAVKKIADKGRGLDALVNNAGIAVIGPLIEVPVEELDWQLNVNVLGPYRVTQAFAPMIIESKGRITTTGSISGILSGSMFGHYSMSKHAVEAFTDSLATEMKRFDVQVSVIEPGNYASKIGESFVKRLERKGYWGEDSAYADELTRMKAGMGNASQSKDPQEVAEAVMHALFSDKPKRRYMVVPNAAQAHFTLGQAMTELLQLNQDQPYSLTRDQLIEMMDKQIKAL